ncbi:uncharacterized protein B0H18DRAFT_1116879 [Fomitopsis serialis]|uniref:uncharacterized protein n=1 Tax=Fomitopsis serialis TaxID=139415 RepID=UPI002008C682|nr:uncharacterized protein B0H18DRAFT_1116879 [Neoantrodia serialis]KAH9930768.1 hypothetical protein B0H18DRAFT_1116879 [Neoantrodia serialis]
MSLDQQVALARPDPIRSESSHLSRAARQVVPPFLQKLYEIVNDPRNDELIRWSENGDSFYVLNHERFAREVLGRWFKHQKFTSFVRQLNMYGFHKIPHLQQGVLKSDTDTEPWNFEHPHFHRGQPDLLCLIQRKKQPANSNAEDGDVPDTTNTSTSHVPPSGQQAISADLNALKKSNEMLWEEATLARQRHDKHQDTINRILKFLAGVFGHSTDTLNTKNDTGRSPSVAPRARQRLMIGDGRAAKGAKAVEIADVADDDDVDLLHSAHPQEGATTPLAGKFPYDILQQLVYEIQRHAGQLSSIESPLMSPTPSTAPSETFSPSIIETTSPGFAGRPTRPTEVLSRTNTSNTSNHGSATDVPSRTTPPPLGTASEPTVSPSTLAALTANTAGSYLPDTAWQTAIQQVLNNPQQMQRLMQALATQQGYSMAPPPDSTFIPQQPPSAQLAPYTPAPFDYSRYRTELPVQVPPSTLPLLSQSIPAHDEAPSLEPLLDNASRLQKSYRDAVEIEADMDQLQSSLHSLIHDLGMDPQALLAQNQEQARQCSGSYTNGAGSIQSAGNGMQQNDPSSDLFLESLLNGMGSTSDSNLDYSDVTDRFDPATQIDGTTVGDASTEQLAAFLDDVSDTASPMSNPTDVAPVPQKRKSDAAGLSLPSFNTVDHVLAGPKTKRKR